MTFDDMQVVERHVDDIHPGGLPTMLSLDYDRVDVDATKLDDTEAGRLVDLLSQELGRKGYLWDVWMATDDHIIHVAEREEAS